MRLCHKRPPEEQSRAQKSEQEGKATQLWDYYNVIPGTAPPLDETELLHVLTEPSTSGVDTQTVGCNNFISMTSAIEVHTAIF